MIWFSAAEGNNNQLSALPELGPYPRSSALVGVKFYRLFPPIANCYAKEEIPASL
jgi:hypothetical protein